MFDFRKWFPEDDPILDDQIRVLGDLLDHQVSDEAFEGFLVVCSRFVDEHGGHRTAELADIFRTTTEGGKKSLRASLEHVQAWVGGLEGYIKNYPVTVIPARPAFPLFRIIGIESLADRLFRVLNSRSVDDATGEGLKEYILSTGRLPRVPRQRWPVRRSKPYFHWCSYEAWDSPEATRSALQILPKWSDCRLRATLTTRRLRRSAYVAFSGDRFDPEDAKLRFYRYFYEPLAQDHPELIGGGPQIGVEGSPIVDLLEEWDEGAGAWACVWAR